MSDSVDLRETTPVEKLKDALNYVEAIANSRPHQYEHEHFMLVEKIARYLIERDTREELEKEEIEKFANERLAKVVDDIAKIGINKVAE